MFCRGQRPQQPASLLTRPGRLPSCLSRSTGRGLRIHSPPSLTKQPARGAWVQKGKAVLLVAVGPCTSLAGLYMDAHS